MKVRPPVGNKLYSQLLRRMLPAAPAVGADDAASWNNALFVDLRSLTEYAVSHIEGAIHREPGHDDTAGLLRHPGPVVFYCTVGYRSGQALLQLPHELRSKVWNLYGGIFEWINRGHPVVRNGQAVAEVHPFAPHWSIWVSRRVRCIYAPPTSER